jgi:hypothetical protein
VCDRPITPGQTWKFTPEGGKVHYYCAEGSQQNPAHLDLSWLQEGDTFAPDFGGQMLKQRVSLYRNSDGRELTVAVEDVLAFNSEPVRLSSTSPYRREVGIWATPIGPTRSRRGFLRDSRYSLVFEGVPGYAYGEKWRLRSARVENPAGPTFHEAMGLARAAGARIGDTSGFEPWLVKAKLDQRSPQVVEALRGEFWRGVEQGESPAAKGQATHRGIKIWKTAEGWKTAVEPESLFDSYREAKEFVEAQARNPHESCNPYDYETTAREFGMNLGGRGPRVQTVRAWVKKAQRQLDEHRAWLRSKGYEDDGVVEKMERKIRWWEIALEEYARKRRVA